SCYKKRNVRVTFLLPFQVLNDTHVNGQVTPEVAVCAAVPAAELNNFILGVLFEDNTDESKIYLLLLFQKQNFIWHTKEPSGHSGGILMGIDMDIYDIGAIDEGDFYCMSLFNLCLEGIATEWDNKYPLSTVTTWALAYDNAGDPAKEEEQDGLSILQYADDTILDTNALSEWMEWKL
ncbi:hypothetical protein ACJX0J_005807, partial [Zea mays]